MKRTAINHQMDLAEELAELKERGQDQGIRLAFYCALFILKSTKKGKRASQQWQTKSISISKRVRSLEAKTEQTIEF